MNPSRFDQIVKNRAQQRVSEKIERFRSAIKAAIRDLNPSLISDSYYEGFIPEKIKPDLALVLANVASGMYYQPGVASRETPLTQVVWPRILWKAEREEVEKQLLATMDEMQKALCAPDAQSNGPQPQEEATP